MEVATVVIYSMSAVLADWFTVGKQNALFTLFNPFNIGLQEGELIPIRPAEGFQDDPGIGIRLTDQKNLSTQASRRRFSNPPAAL